MALTYLIDAPPYSKDSGGSCALHYLAHELGKLTGHVYLITEALNPRWDTIGINRKSPIFIEGNNQLGSKLYRLIDRLKRYVVFQTFVRKLKRLQNRLFIFLLWKHFDKNKTVVIYPEIVKGNPLKGTHIVRWILNTPGVCGGDGVFRENDHIFLYHPWFKVNAEYKIRGLLTAIDLDYQLRTYRNYGLANRKGGAYLIRKGRSKKHNLHPSDFIHADPVIAKMSDEEVAQFFNAIQTFISYDEMTWVSVQAALCGCTSIIIPGEGDRSEENLKQVNRINGVAYGFNDQDWVDKTIHQLRPHFESLNNEYRTTIRDFYAYCEREIGTG